MDVLKAFQVVAGREAHHLARRIIFQVPEIGFVPVGVEAKWQFAAELLLNVVAILLGLLSPDGGIAAGFFCFHYGKWFAVFSQQDVVAELMAFVFGARLCNTVGQASQNVELFDDLRRVFDVPAGRTKLGINQPGTCLSL